MPLPAFYITLSIQNIGVPRNPLKMAEIGLQAGLPPRHFCPVCRTAGSPEALQELVDRVLELLDGLRVALLHGVRDAVGDVLADNLLAQAA